jgi:uncharacterized membrane protein YgcG
MPIKYRPIGTTGIYAPPLISTSVDSLGLTMAGDGTVCIAVCIVIVILLATCRSQRFSVLDEMHTCPQKRCTSCERRQWAEASRRARSKKKHDDASELTVVIYIALFIIVALALVTLFLVICFAAELKVVQQYWQRVLCIVLFVTIIVLNRPLLPVQKCRAGGTRSKGKKRKGRRRRLRGEPPPHHRRQNKRTQGRKEYAAASRRRGSASKSTSKTANSTTTKVPGQTRTFNAKDVGVSKPSSDSDSFLRKPCCHTTPPSTTFQNARHGGCALPCGGSRGRSGLQRGSTSATVSGSGGDGGSGRRRVKDQGTDGYWGRSRDVVVDGNGGASAGASEERIRDERSSRRAAREEQQLQRRNGRVHGWVPGSRVLVYNTGLTEGGVGFRFQGLRLIVSGVGLMVQANTGGGVRDVNRADEE